MLLIPPCRVLQPGDADALSSLLAKVAGRSGTGSSTCSTGSATSTLTGSAAGGDAVPGNDGAHLPAHDCEALEQRDQVTKVLSIAEKLLGEPLPPLASSQLTRPSSSQAQQASASMMELGPFTLLVGTKGVYQLTSKELLDFRRNYCPAIDAASGCGVMVQVRAFFASDIAVW